MRKTSRMTVRQLKALASIAEARGDLHGAGMLRTRIWLRQHRVGTRRTLNAAR